MSNIISTSANSESIPFPHDNFVQAVRASCRNCRERSLIQINEDAITDFIQNIDPNHFQELTKSDGLQMPLKFDNLGQELNIIGLISLLNFGSGFRKELHKECGRGAFNTIRYGIMSIHITSSSLSARTLRSLTLSEVSSFFQIPLNVEVTHPTIEAIKISEHSKSRRFAELITWTLNDTGRRLEEYGFKSFAAFILEAAKPASPDEKSKASKFVEKLVRAFPAFRDMTKVDGEPVYIFKKAQLLAANLYRHFHSNAQTNNFDFSDISDLTVCADNVISTILYHFNIINLTPLLKQYFDGEEIINIQDATRLRAAVLDACEIIVSRAKESGRNEISLMDLNEYIWRIGKDENFRKLERPIFRDTMFF
ncbi:5552_t:CDS:2 [Funneliformis geosporum]|uniref:Queuosine 5'-phosphate N-glycosylase/hydrolase n=1 Tax=Funneliformis geosporum TaxID=1117311 RepID=A0A9W4SFZ6_9GLOM|nr:1764_t:CDS:2 [Funneliformis geosporum]CAI2169266.1 5552_t:CDS:2 [Funneliformis geosporum]